MERIPTLSGVSAVRFDDKSDRHVAGAAPGTDAPPGQARSMVSASARVAPGGANADTPTGAEAVGSPVRERAAVGSAAGEDGLALGGKGPCSSTGAAGMHFIGTTASAGRDDGDMDQLVGPAAGPVTAAEAEVKEDVSQGVGEVVEGVAGAGGGLDGPGGVASGSRAAKLGSEGAGLGPAGFREVVEGGELRRGGDEGGATSEPSGSWEGGFRVPGRAAVGSTKDEGEGAGRASGMRVAAELSGAANSAVSMGGRALASGDIAGEVSKGVARDPGSPGRSSAAAILDGVGGADAEGEGEVAGLAQMHVASQMSAGAASGRAEVVGLLGRSGEGRHGDSGIAEQPMRAAADGARGAGSGGPGTLEDDRDPADEWLR